MEVDWAALTMTFKAGGMRVVLKGDPSLTKAEVSLKPLARSSDIQDQGFLVEFRAITGYLIESSDSIPPVAIPRSIDKLLTEYRSVFQIPEGLPPKREVDHRILLNKGQPPVNVRLYRYLRVQKIEIERLIGEMLTAVIIRPSVGPYSSPVLLVKKDGSWRFCVDYRALNNVTVPDKFPISVVEELLDELHGSSIYSKIDLKSGYHQI